MTRIALLYDPMYDDPYEIALMRPRSDTDKTPWSASPDTGVGQPHDTAGRQDTEGSLMPESTPPGLRPPAGKTTDRARDHRPLPPLAGGDSRRHQPVRASDFRSAWLPLQKVRAGRTEVTSPPPASHSKSDFESIGNPKMTLEPKLMMLSEDGSDSCRTTTRASL